MSSYSRKNLEETLKNFLIVGETLDGLHSFTEYRYRYLFTGTILAISGMISFIGSFSQGMFWVFLAIVFLFSAFYFFLKFKIRISYGITKFRVIRVVEGDLVSRYFFRSSQLIGFSDLHYEHVEQINITTPSLNMVKLYLSVFSLTIGWILFNDLENLNELNLDIPTISGISFLIGGLIILLFSIPIGGVRLRLQSVSGDAMEFPEKQTPKEFIDELILNCRTFLSYGAV